MSGRKSRYYEKIKGCPESYAKLLLQKRQSYERRKEQIKEAKRNESEEQSAIRKEKERKRKQLSRARKKQQTSCEAESEVPEEISCIPECAGLSGQNVSILGMVQAPHYEQGDISVSHEQLQEMFTLENPFILDGSQAEGNSEVLDVVASSNTSPVPSSLLSCDVDVLQPHGTSSTAISCRRSSSWETSPVANTAILASQDSVCAPSFEISPLPNMVVQGNELVQDENIVTPPSLGMVICSPPSTSIRVQASQENKDTNLEERYHLPENPFFSPASKGRSKKNKGISRQKKQGEKRAKENRAKLKMKILDLQSDLKEMKKLKDRYRKKYAREKLKNMQLTKKLKESNKDSPEQRVEELLQGREVDADIRQELLFGEVMKSQMKHNFQEQKSRKGKALISALNKGPLMKKFRMMRKCKEFSLKSFTRKKANKRLIRKKAIALLISKFYLDDSNSSFDPNKKSTITRKGIKMQKRYLNMSVLDLHKKYLRSQDPSNHVNYALFSRLRPFWVVKPKIAERDTCACTKHENIKLQVQKLHKLGLIEQSSPEQVINAIACQQRTENCLARTCSFCADKRIKLKDISQTSEDVISYKQWTSKKEKRISGKTKKEIEVSITLKETIVCTQSDLTEDFENSFPLFMIHERDNWHQQSFTKQLKMNLKSHEMCLHIDFAENYNCKYAQETQSVHFGASRQQISLHTGVMYSENLTKCFCSVSSSLQHDAFSVLAHLRPVLDRYLAACEEITTLHFISDGPSSQYKNKTMFGILAKSLPDIYPQLEVITWNFSVPGHGKGPADGVGAAVKGEADSIVAHGSDLETFEKFSEALLSSNINVDIDIVTTEDIETSEQISFENKKPFNGTKKVYQVTWTRPLVGSPSKLYFNSLSCLSCNYGQQCSHFHLGFQEFS